MGLRAGKAPAFGLLCDFVSARTLTTFWLIPVVQSRYISLQEREKSKGSILPSKFGQASAMARRAVLSPGRKAAAESAGM